MGSAYASNQLKAGVAVEGTDISPEAKRALEVMGGKAHDAIGDWLKSCEVIFISVASVPVLVEVTNRLSEVLNAGQIVIETGTFSMTDKLAAKEAVEKSGAILLDCPVSGTGPQAAVADLVMMASGPKDAIIRVMPFLDNITKRVLIAGEFGAGSKLKYVANHVVALHNAAAAEALNYADTMGLDRQVVYDLLANGAATSKMLELRMPIMISGAYEPPTATMRMFLKDISIISSDIDRVGAQTPMFDVVAKLYETAEEIVPWSNDSAAVFEVYKAKMA